MGMLLKSSGFTEWANAGVRIPPSPIILPTTPYGLCNEERGWKYAEIAQPTTPFLGGVAVGC